MPNHRLYLDESGDHTYKRLNDPNGRFLSLTGIIVESGYYRTVLRPGLEELKRVHFGDDPDRPVVLHLEDIKTKVGPFKVLRSQAKRNHFESDLIDFVAGHEFSIITVAID